MGDGKAVRFNDAELTLKQLFESIKGAFVWRLMWGGCACGNCVTRYFTRNTSRNTSSERNYFQRVERRMGTRKKITPTSFSELHDVVPVCVRCSVWWENKFTRCCVVHVNRCAAGMPANNNIDTSMWMSRKFYWFFRCCCCWSKVSHRYALEATYRNLFNNNLIRLCDIIKRCRR